MSIPTARWAERVDERVRLADEVEIRACILDYFDGWFDGDADRMERALHPGLAKHSLGQDRDHSDNLELATKSEMVDATREGVGRSRDPGDRAIHIEVAAVSGNIASAVVHSAVYVELLLLARTAAGWRITSALWRWAAGHGPRD